MYDNPELLPALKPRKAMKRSVATKTINLALQGGGAHGAFCWGVLDRLLEDERVAFEGVSATSAGRSPPSISTVSPMRAWSRYSLAMRRTVPGRMSQMPSAHSGV